MKHPNQGFLYVNRTRSLVSCSGETATAPAQAVRPVPALPPLHRNESVYLPIWDPVNRNALVANQKRLVSIDSVYMMQNGVLPLLTPDAGDIFLYFPVPVLNVINIACIGCKF